MFNDEDIGMGFNSESGLAVSTALEGFTVPEDEAGQARADKFRQATATWTIPPG